MTETKLKSEETARPEPFDYENCIANTAQLIKHAKRLEMLCFQKDEEFRQLAKMHDSLELLLCLAVRHLTPGAALTALMEDGQVKRALKMQRQREREQDGCTISNL